MVQRKQSYLALTAEAGALLRKESCRPRRETLLPMPCTTKCMTDVDILKMIYGITPRIQKILPFTFYLELSHIYDMILFSHHSAYKRQDLPVPYRAEHTNTLPFFPPLLHHLVPPSHPIPPSHATYTANPSALPSAPSTARFCPSLIPLLMSKTATLAPSTGLFGANAYTFVPAIAKSIIPIFPFVLL